jgi:hypothetical protein
LKILLIDQKGCLHLTESDRGDNDGIPSSIKERKIRNTTYN